MYTALPVCFQTGHSCIATGIMSHTEERRRMKEYIWVYHCHTGNMSISRALFLNNNPRVRKRSIYIRK